MSKKKFENEKYQHLITRSKGITQVDDIIKRHYDVIGESKSGFKLMCA